MCDKLADLRRAVSRYSTRFDPEVVTCADAKKVVKDAAAIEAMASTLKSLAAARVAQSNSWRQNGHRSASEELALDTGTSVSAARDAIETGQRLATKPELSAAARRGELSFPQTSMIASAVEADPAAEAGLVEKAPRLSLSELRDKCAETKASAHPDLEARRNEIHSKRFLRPWTDVEGVWHLSAGGNPEKGAVVMAALSPISDEIFRTARAEGRRENPQAYAFDALVRLAEESLARTTEETGGPRSKASSSPRRTEADREQSNPSRRRGAPVTLLVRIDYDTWLRGAPTEGETCELVGFGPIAVSAVRDLVASGDPFVAAILTKGQELVGVAHLGRRPNRYQESALRWLYPSCAVEGCAAQARLERDHRVEWSKTHFTAFELLDLLCSYHHSLKTREGWELVEDRGKRRFVPITDPGHPRFKDPKSSRRTISENRRL
jgi:hypothetical protein